MKLLQGVIHITIRYLLSIRVYRPQFQFFLFGHSRSYTFQLKIIRQFISYSQVQNFCPYYVNALTLYFCGQYKALYVCQIPIQNICHLKMCTYRQISRLICCHNLLVVLIKGTITAQISMNVPVLDWQSFDKRSSLVNIFHFCLQLHISGYVMHIWKKSESQYPF